MRYYAIDLNLGTELIIPDYMPKDLKHSFCSHRGNSVLPGALNVEMDIPLNPLNTPQKGTRVRIWGVPLKGLDVDYTGYTMKVWGGMKPGLPIATRQSERIPPTSKPLVEGTVLMSFGNWTGTNMSLDFVLAPLGALPQVQVNLPFTWPEGTLLADAIRTTMKTGYGADVDLQINISAELKSTDSNYGATRFTTLTEFGRHIQQISMQPKYVSKIKTVSGAPYTGVTGIVAPGGSPNPGNNANTRHSFKFFDNSDDAARSQAVTTSGQTTTAGGVTTLPTITVTATPDGSYKNPVEIQFEDLIGQPTLLNVNAVSFTTILRNDLEIGTWIKLPVKARGFTSITIPSVNVPYLQRSQSILQGTLQVRTIQHFANYRQPDGASWVTMIQAFPVEPINLQTGNPGPAVSTTQ